MEHTLGVYSPSPISTEDCGLNPCFSGTYSRRIVHYDFVAIIYGLNPCFSGTYSRRISEKDGHTIVHVLILVLVEHTLGDKGVLETLVRATVLILVLVEHTLGVAQKTVPSLAMHGLNPCFSGTYSRRVRSSPKQNSKSCLNPCFSGTYSRSDIQGNSRKNSEVS